MIEGLTIDEPLRKWDFFYEGNGMVMMGYIIEEANPTCFNIYLNNDIVGTGYTFDEATELLGKILQEAYEKIKDDI